MNPSNNFEKFISSDLLSFTCFSIGGIRDLFPQVIKTINYKDNKIWECVKSEKYYVTNFPNYLIKEIVRRQFDPKSEVDFDTSLRNNTTLNYLFPRYRGCGISKCKPGFYVRTRSGGDNREEYQNEIEEAEILPGFITSYDSIYDETYMIFKYKIIDERCRKEWKLWRDLILNSGDDIISTHVNVYMTEEERRREYPEYY